MLSPLNEYTSQQALMKNQLQNQQSSQLQPLSQFRSTFQSTNSSQKNMHRTEAKYYPKQCRIQISKPQAHLYYIAVSTEPSRQFEAARYMGLNESKKINDSIEINLRRSSGIIQNRERFCVLGYNIKQNVIQETIRCKVEDFSEQKIEQKNQILYFSRNIVEARVNSQKEGQEQQESQVKVTRPQELKSHEIQTLLKYIRMKFGSFCKISAQKNILTVEFNTPLPNNSNQEQIINPFIFSKTVKTARDPKVNHKTKLFKYYSITMHRPIFYVNPVPLIQFPPETKIQFLQLLNNWIIIGTRKEVAFFHIDAPLDNFLMIPDLKINDMKALSSERIALMEDRYLTIYEVNSKRKPQFLSRIKFRSLQIHSMCNLSNGDCLISGIDYSYFLNSRVSQKYVHLLKGMQNFESRDLREIKIQKSMLICSQNPNFPVNHLTPTSSSQTFVCSCDKTVYLCHFQTQSVLAQIQLKGSIQKIRQIDYPTNIVNVLILAKKTKIFGKSGKKQYSGLCRIGFDEHQSCVGTEVQNIEGNGENVLDFSIEDSYVLSTDGRSIIKYKGLDDGVRTRMILDELKKDKEVEMRSQEMEEKKEKYRIERLLGKNEVIFSVQKQHVNGVYLLQI